MSHVLNGVTHSVGDDVSDGIFVINPTNKTITLEVDGSPAFFGGPVLVKGDHNSERLTFTIPSKIEGHDMTDCNLVRIHYIVTDAATSERDKSIYDVPDSDRTTEGDNIKFSWLIDRRVTQFVGPVAFVVQFACTEQDGVDSETGNPRVLLKYSWSTLPYTELRVSDGIINDDEDAAADFEVKYEQTITKWLNEIEAALAPAAVKMEQTVTSTDDEGENVWTAYNDDGDIVSEFTVRNGSKGSDGLSAYQVAYANALSKGEDIGNEEDWLNSLKAAGYEDCLKGEVLTEEEYEAKVNAGSIEEGFAYIIKSETLHADSATTAAGYTEDGAIAAKFSTIDSALGDKAESNHTHDEYAPTDHTHDEYASAEPVSETNSVSVSYTCSATNSGSTAKPQYEITSDPVTVYIADGLICTHAEITSCSLTGATYNVEVSSDGNKLTFTLSGYAGMYPGGGSHKATLEYTYTTVRPGYKSTIADHLSLTQSAIEDIPGRGTYTSGESIPDRQVYVSPGRAYLLVRHPYHGTLPRYFETAMLYVDNNVVPANTPPPCLSTPFSNGSRVVVYQSESDGLWYAYGIDSEGNYTKIPYVAFIEL